MLEIALGLLVTVAGLVAGGGWLAGAIVLPGIGPGSHLAVISVGLAFTIHGLVRRARGRTAGPARFWLRTAGLAATGSAATLILAVALPLAAAPMGLFKLGGFPLNYYVAAELVPILLVALMFWHRAAADRIDAEESGE